MVCAALPLANSVRDMSPLAAAISIVPSSIALTIFGRQADVSKLAVVVGFWRLLLCNNRCRGLCCRLCKLRTGLVVRVTDANVTVVVVW